MHAKVKEHRYDDPTVNQCRCKAGNFADYCPYATTKEMIEWSAYLFYKNGLPKLDAEGNL